MSTLSLASIVVRSPDQVSTSLSEEVGILGLAAEEYYSLKEVGAAIWKMIETPKTVGEIRAAILARYAVEPERCERDLLADLQDLADEGLIEVK
jgi:hypothetical protein